MTLGFRWFDEAGNEVQLALSDQQVRTSLPRDLPSGQCLAIAVRVRAPRIEGCYLLRISVVHELVAWLDDLYPHSGARAWVVVGDRATQPVKFGGRYRGSGKQNRQTVAVCTHHQ